MGEKDLFYDCLAHVPMIVHNPLPQADARRVMIFDGRWKLTHVVRLTALHVDWPRQHHARTTLEAKVIEEMAERKARRAS